MQTKVQKNMRGNWEAVTEVEFDKDEQGRERIVQLLTTKRSSGNTATTAQVCVIERGMMSYVMFQDYSETVYNDRVRCTERVVTEQHKQALAQMESIKHRARLHYEKQNNS